MQLKTEHSWKHWLALVVILLAAVFMEAIMGFQYRFARQQLEAELERSTLMDLNTSALYIQEVLSNAEVAVRNEVVHAERQIHDRSYLNEIIRTMVANDRKNLDGAFLCFEPNFYPDKGQWYELYARQNGPSIEIAQIGSARHDYTSREFYRSAIEEGSSQWTDPYWDEDGAGAWVLTYAQPLSYQGRRIGVLGVDLTTTWINDVVNHYHPHPSSFCMVLTEDGKLIAAPSDTAVVTSTMLLKLVDMFNDSTVERTLVGKGRITRFTFLDDECGERGRVYYARKARSPYWQMLLVCYDSEVFGELDKVRGYMLLLAIIGLAILTVIVLLFLRASKKLQVSQLSQERIGAELHVANEIQQSMLPHYKLRLDEMRNYSSVSAMLVAKVRLQLCSWRSPIRSSVLLLRMRTILHTSCKPSMSSPLPIMRRTCSSHSLLACSTCLRDSSDTPTRATTILSSSMITWLRCSIVMPICR